MVHKFKRAVWVLIFFLALFVSTAEAVKGDKRVIKTLTLENGLDVFLVSDPDVHRSAAALSVGVGHYMILKKSRDWPTTSNICCF